MTLNFVAPPACIPTKDDLEQQTRAAVRCARGAWKDPKWAGTHRCVMPRCARDLVGFLAVGGVPRGRTVALMGPGMVREAPARAGLTLASRAFSCARLHATTPCFSRFRCSARHRGGQGGGASAAQLSCRGRRRRDDAAQSQSLAY